MARFLNHASESNSFLRSSSICSGDRRSMANFCDSDVGADDNDDSDDNGSSDGFSLTVLENS
jgi:hypothetical protein